MGNIKSFDSFNEKMLKKFIIFLEEIKIENKKTTQMSGFFVFKINPFRLSVCR